MGRGDDECAQTTSSEFVLVSLACTAEVGGGGRGREANNAATTMTRQERGRERGENYRVAMMCILQYYKIVVALTYKEKGK